MIVSETALAVGDLAHAERSARAILRLAEEQSDSRGRDLARGWGLYLLGVCAGRRGDHSQAVESLRESSALTQQTDDVLYHLAAEGRLVVELGIGGALEEAAERGRLAATELRRREIRHPFLVVDGPFLIAAALLRQREGNLSAELTAAARRVRWLRGGVARIMRVTLPVYLAGRGAWSIAHGGEGRGTHELARAAKIASGHELYGVLLDVHRVGAAVLPVDSAAGRWHQQARDELRAPFSPPVPGQGPSAQPAGRVPV